MRIIILLLGILCGAALPAYAEKPKMFWYKDGKTHYFDAMSAEILLGYGSYKRYKAAIAMQDCDPAFVMLNTAFVTAYPQFKYVAAPPVGKIVPLKDMMRALEWLAVFAKEKYPELNLCYTINIMKEVEAVIVTKQDFKPEKYSGSRPFPPNFGDGSRESLLYRRDQLLLDMAVAADKGLAPAFKMLIGFVQQGDVFAVGADVEYYLIKRFCHLQGECAEFEARLGELSKQIAPAKLSSLAKRAKSAVGFARRALIEGRRL
jgi:hypothetical protein